MAYMQSPAPESVHADSSPDTSPGVGAQHTDTVPDLVYSDEDVIILHDIVALAQHDLDTAPSPKPLPAAALFKAYDEVLPSYGIDPDRDHHLSAFVFRVGGEEGDTPLLHKFQTILGQLGIAVELGEEQDRDDEDGVQVSPAPSTTRSVRSAFNRALKLHSRLTPERHSSNRRGLARVPELERASHEHTEESSLASPVHIAPGRSVSRRSADGFADTFPVDHGFDESDHGRPKAKSGTRSRAQRQESSLPPQLESDLNRWISAAQAQRANIFTSPARTAASSAPSTREVATPERPIESRQSQVSQLMRDQLARPANPSPPSLMSLIDGWRSLALEQPRKVASSSRHERDLLNAEESAHNPDASRQHAAPLEVEARAPIIEDLVSHQGQLQVEDRLDFQDPASAIHQAAATAVLSQAKHEHTQREATKLPLTKEEIGQVQVQQQKLMYRAARARELYLASKYFNHWADRTARRLEREGVARRHMIRFRCFRGWSQMPSSRDPAIDHLRASATAQKLLRATSAKKLQLDDLAAYAVQMHQRSGVLRVLALWRRCVAISEAQVRTVERLKARIALRWQMQSATDAAAFEAARLRGQQIRRGNIVTKWQIQAENHHVQVLAARDIGDARLGFSCLRKWWDRSETNRRAKIYRKYLYTAKVAHTNSVWNLAARSQAFKWNSDYRTVSRIFDKWEVLARYDQESKFAAQALYEKQTKARICRGLDKARRDHCRVERVQKRVRLYITATRTLHVFNETVTRRKADEKERVKKRLMMKYKQASSARKKRQFFAALSLWQASAQHNGARTQLASDARSALNDRKQAHALDSWAKQTTADDENMDLAVQRYVISRVDRWSSFAEEEAQREARAWEAWGAGRQRIALKDWSILSLQRRGQAHTAEVACQKHSWDRRRRILQHWKQQSDKTKDANADLGDFTPAPVSLRSYRQSWRLFSDRSRGVSNRSSLMSTAETPTRWTGQMSLMSSTMGQNPMPAVEEADEKGLTKSPADGTGGFRSPVRVRPDDNVFGNLASTTPLAPVPSHIHRGYGIADGTQPPVWPRPAMQQRSQHVPSRLGPAMPRRIFPRSLQDHSSDESSSLKKAPVIGSSIFLPGEPQVQTSEGSLAGPFPASAAMTTTPRPSRTPQGFIRNSPQVQAGDQDGP